MVIKKTVARLPLSAVLPLVEEVRAKFLHIAQTPQCGKSEKTPLFSKLPKLSVTLSRFIGECLFNLFSEFLQFLNTSIFASVDHKEASRASFHVSQSLADQP